MEEIILRTASHLSESRSCVALTGAGISVDSGIHAFRGYQGLWERYDPAEYAYISAFRMNPEKVWKMLGEMFSLLLEARPNPAHFALAKLEKMGILHYIITQNIDGLHQMAGSERVIEYHGSAWTLVCLNCGERYDTGEKVKEEKVPLCNCGSVLKPDVVFFGEPIPGGAATAALDLASNADLFMVVGTSGTVAPANELPFVALANDVPIIVINPERSVLSDYPGTLWIDGTANQSLTKIVDIIEKQSPSD